MKSVLVFFSVILLFGGCKSSSQLYSDKQDFEIKKIAGFWYGELPCADCESISYQLNIKPDNSFSEHSVYNGKSKTSLVDKGSWELLTGNILKIKGQNSERMFLVSNDNLIMLDSEGKQITSSLKDKYILSREKIEQDINLSRKLLEEGYDFMARGNEPFWSLNIDFDKAMRFTSLTEIAEFNTPAVEGVKAQDADVTRYQAFVESGEMDVTIVADNCIDNMSGEKFSHSVYVRIKRGNDKDFKEFNGCGKFLEDYRLNDIWVMIEMTGFELDKNKLMKGFPVFEFQLSAKKFVGHAGCNNLTSPIKVMGDKIKFGKLISTKMTCPDMSLEQKIAEILNDNSLSYKIDTMTLTLEAKSGIKMLFKKSD